MEDEVQSLSSPTPAVTVGAMANRSSRDWIIHQSMRQTLKIPRRNEGAYTIPTLSRLFNVLVQILDEDMLILF